MCFCLQIYIFHHLLGYQVISAPTVYYHLAYPVSGFASSYEQIVPLD
jgi:hypothetical protein